MHRGNKKKVKINERERKKKSILSTCKNIITKSIFITLKIIKTSNVFENIDFCIPKKKKIKSLSSDLKITTENNKLLSRSNLIF